LLIGMVGLAALAASHVSSPDRRRRRPTRWWLGGFSIVLGLAVVLTGSRMGIALLPAALLAQWLLLRSGPAGARRASLPAIAAGIVALALGLVLLLRRNAALQAVVRRFDMTRDARIDLWSDSLYAIGQYWPFGSGMGTFVPAFVAAERLEAVDPTMPNRAHNDFLELALESGAFGAVILLLAIALLAVMAVRAWRTCPQDRSQVIFGVTTLIIVAAHSVVDYPLRSMALACIAALGAGMLAMPPVQSRSGGTSSPDPS